MMQKIKSYVLPIAIVLGLLLHDYCAAFSVVVPYIIFTILLLTFTAVDITKLRFKPLFIWIILFQVVVSLGSYALLRLLHVNGIIAEGVLIGVLCPVAASVAVVSTMLGADRNMVTSYSVIGNLLVSLVAPIYFSFIGVNQDMPFLASFLQILRRIGTVIGLPFVVALALQLWWPKANKTLSRYKGLAFYLWAVALFLTLGQTIHFIFLNGKGNWNSILWLGISALLFCIIQFGVGKWIGSKYGDTIAGGQLLGQKNSAMGIWMANHYLHPLAEKRPLDRRYSTRRHVLHPREFVVSQKLKGKASTLLALFLISVIPNLPTVEQVLED